MSDAELTVEEKRDFFVEKLLTTWKDSEETFFKKLWTSVTAAMQFVGHYQGWAGTDKKAEVLLILAVLLEKTDSPGPDWLVDKFIEEAAEFGIDALYNAFKGKFNFDGDATS